jgi:predicted permease
MNDLRYTLRQLLKNPGFTAVAVLTLALGIGANTAIFSLVNALLLRPLPFPGSDHLVWIANPIPGEGLPGLTRRSNLFDWLKWNHSFENLGAYIGFSDRMNSTLTDHGEPVRVESAVVTGSFLETLGIAPRLGRGFLAEECQKNGPNAIILTDRFWKERFQADPGIVGKSITLNNKSWPVVGILPERFEFSSVFTPGARAVDFLRPFKDTPGYDNWGNMMAVVGRLKTGVSINAAQAELEVLNKQLQVGHPERGEFGAHISPLRERISGSFRRPFIVLSCAVGCVMLIACANLSNLLLARAAARRKEIAVRVALGAGRARLVRQLLTESLLLSGFGAVLGLPIAFLAVGAIIRSSALSLPLIQNAGVDATTLCFTVFVASAAGLILGLVPALQFSQSNLQEDLKESGRASNPDKRRHRMRGALIVCEVAMSCVLLVCAGLFLRSFARMIEVDLGFHPSRAAAWRIVPNREFASRQQEIAFYQDLVRRVRAVPGVESATLASTLPLELNDVVRVHPQGSANRPDEMRSVFLREVGEQDYFRTMGIPLRTGRDFDPHDVNATPKSVIVNETLARMLWPARDAVGQLLVLESPPDPPINCKVLALVGDVRQSALEQAAGPEMYLFNWGGRELIVRSSSSLQAIAPLVRASLKEFNPNMAVDEFKPLEQILERIVSPKRLVALLLALFSLMALLLASIGIYGVTAYSVSQRTQEMGIRLALGSTQGALLRLVIGEGMSIVILGCALGLMAAMLVTRVLQALLFETSPTDPLTFAGTLSLLLGVAMLACWLPARRATKVNPMEALRCE